MERIESLEARQLLAGVTVTLTTSRTGGLLRIAGTGGDDAVQLALKGKTQFTVSDGTQTLTFGRAAVKNLTFKGGAGNDSISLGHVQLRAYLDGGDGNDSLSASSGESNDTLVGGNGDDYLYGGPGDDTLNGGAGGDLMLGGDGYDHLDGGTGGDLMLGGDGNDEVTALSDTATNDTISGGQGHDAVYFGQYAAGVIVRVGVTAPPAGSVSDIVLGDMEGVIGSAHDDRISNESARPMYLYGEAGNDTLIGGRASETLVGGTGDDSLVGAGGNDQFKAANADVSGEGADTLDGGSGTDDVAYYDDTDTVRTMEGRIRYSEGPEFEQIYYGPHGELIGF